MITLMFGVLDVAWLVLALFLGVPCLILLVQCLAALASGRTAALPALPRARSAVLVPAHDEQSIIRETVLALLPELGPSDRLLVIADNCSDATAAIAREAGATVLERRDPERRGKGFALAFGLEHLAAEPPAVVIIVDADCRVAPGGLARLAERAEREHRPIQADYLLTAPANSGPKAAVSAFAFLVRNRVRARGMAVLGMPVQLTGSGMAFPWDVIRAAAATESHVVEDLVMGIDLTIKGFGPRLAPEVEVTSSLPTSDRAAATQRKRWETGQLSTLLEFVPRLVGQGLKSGRSDLIGLGLDLSVPPLALQVSLLLGATAVAVGLALFAGRVASLSVLALDWLALITALGAAWFAYGRKTLPLRYIAVIPLYVLWKIPLYLSFLVRGRQKAWVRTERS